MEKLHRNIGDVEAIESVPLEDRISTSSTYELIETGCAAESRCDCPVLPSLRGGLGDANRGLLPGFPRAGHTVGQPVSRPRCGTVRCRHLPSSKPSTDALCALGSRSGWRRQPDQSAAGAGPDPRHHAVGEDEGPRRPRRASRLRHLAEGGRDTQGGPHPESHRAGHGPFGRVAGNLRLRGGHRSLRRGKARFGPPHRAQGGLLPLSHRRNHRDTEARAAHPHERDVLGGDVLDGPGPLGGERDDVRAAAVSRQRTAAHGTRTALGRRLHRAPHPYRLPRPRRDPELLQDRRTLRVSTPS